MNRLILVVLLLLLISHERFVRAQGIHASSSTVSPVNQTRTPDTYKGRQIIVSSGGGFTGSALSYYLLENGKVFGRRSRDTTYTFISQQTATTTKKMFSWVEGTCKIRKTKFDNPGNIYKLVGWRKDTLDYSVTWGATGKTVPASYPKFYASFMALIPTASRMK